jgi:hypothetical protein
MGCPTRLSSLLETVKRPYKPSRREELTKAIGKSSPDARK